MRVIVREREDPAAPGSEVELYRASHALVIGINAYQAGWPRLSNAVQDTALVAEALQSQGFDVTPRTDLDSTGLKQAFEEFFVLKGQDPESRLLVWFAGHGHTESGEGYLVPADAPPPSQAAAFRLKALSVRRFGEYARQARSKHVLAVFDSCFAGTVFSSVRGLPPAAITRATTLPVRQFITSGEADQTVSDDGTFRKLFLRALSGEESRADANGDGYVTGAEMGFFLSDRLTNLTSNRQTPRYGKLRDEDWDRGDFVFKVAARAALAPESPLRRPGILLAQNLRVQKRPGLLTLLDRPSGEAIWRRNGGYIECLSHTQSGHIIVCERERDDTAKVVRILKLDRDERVVRELKGDFLFITDAQESSDESLLLSFTQPGRILRADWNGSTLWSMTGFHWPTQAQPLPDESTLVADGTPSLKRLDTKTGATIQSIPLPHWAGAAKRLPNGSTLVGLSGAVILLDEGNNVVWRHGDVSRPSSVEPMASGEVLVSDPDNNRILVLDGQTGRVVWSKGGLEELVGALELR